MIPKLDIFEAEARKPVDGMTRDTHRLVRLGLVAPLLAEVLRDIPAILPKFVHLAFAEGHIAQGEEYIFYMSIVTRANAALAAFDAAQSQEHTP